MQYIIYLIFRWSVFLFSLLPFRMIYAISDLAFLVVYYLVRYRRNVVNINLRNSFPEKDEEQIREITKKFYHHFCDILFESVKVYSIPHFKVVERYRFRDTEKLDDLALKGISVICVTGHYNNWEWGGIASEKQLLHRAIGFYKPLSNKYIDKYVALHRTRGANRVASVERTHPSFMEYSDIPSIFYMIADQSPPSARMVHWVTFLKQDSAVISGPDRYARMMNMPVYYAKIVKVKRGFYEVFFISLCDDPKNVKPGEITKIFMNTLEESIIENPEYYLWSHRRWKHKKS